MGGILCAPHPSMHYPGLSPESLSVPPLPLAMLFKKLQSNSRYTVTLALFACCSLILLLKSTVLPCWKRTTLQQLSTWKR